MRVLLEDLREDTKNLINLLKYSSRWRPDKDLKLKRLNELLNKESIKKSIIFSQSKETASYLYSELSKNRSEKIDLVVGGMDNIVRSEDNFIRFNKLPIK